MNTTESTSTMQPAIKVYDYYWERIIYASLIALISIVGTLGNCLVIIAVCLSRKLRTKTNVLVVNLSVADLISCINLPWMSIAVLSENGWPLPDWICSLEGAVMILSIGCSLYTLGGIAVSRCCLITLSRARYHELFTTFNMAAMITFFWVVPIAVIAIAISFGKGFLGYSERYSMCIWDTQHTYTKTFNVLLMVVFYPIPLGAISVSSYKIWHFVRSHTRRIATAMPSVSGGIGAGTTTTSKSQFSKRQMAVTKNLFLIIAMFLVLMSPYGVILVVPGGEKLVPGFGVILLLNSCTNPFIYGTRHPDFKIAFRHLLRCKTNFQIARESSFRPEG